MRSPASNPPRAADPLTACLGEPAVATTRLGEASKDAIGLGRIVAMTEAGQAVLVQDACAQLATGAYADLVEDRHEGPRIV